MNASSDLVQEIEIPTRHESFAELPVPQKEKRNKYGNMKILLETEKVLITIGPDCTISNKLDGCFIAGFLSFAVADYFLITTVNEAF